MGYKHKFKWDIWISNDSIYFKSTKSMFMENLLELMKTYVSLTKDEARLIENCLEEEELNSNSLIINAGNVAHYIYFLSRGIVKGYQNIEGKIIIQHLVSENEFFTSLDSFMNKTPAIDFYEAISDCKVLKISKIVPAFCCAYNAKT